MRNLCGSLQFSDEYYSTYKEANENRKRQVNPSHWYIVVNPGWIGAKQLNMRKEERIQRELLNVAYNALRKLV